MTQSLKWRQAVQIGDVARIRELVADTKVFTPEEISVAGELVEEKLLKGIDCSYQFLLVENATEVLGYTCFGSIPLTEQRYDLYWIAVDPSYQNQGLGKQLLQQTEQLVVLLGGQHLYAETSGRKEYLPTRNFYRNNNYQQVAELNNFYRDGDNKVIYCKILSLGHQS